MKRRKINKPTKDNMLKARVVGKHMMPHHFMPWWKHAINDHHLIYSFATFSSR